MKKLFAGFCGMLILAGTFAQDKECKYDKNESDKFTHKKIVWTQWEQLTTFFGQAKEFVPSVRCVQEDTLKQLIIYYDGYYSTNAKPARGEIDSQLVIPVGSKVDFLMEDQKTVELVTVKPQNSEGQITSPFSGDNKTEKYRVHWFLGVSYRLDEMAIKALSLQGTTAMRVYFKNDKYMDYNIHKKKYGALQHLMSCIVSSGN